MNPDQSSLNEKLAEPPWYKQFWPWFIIALPASAVIASFITLYLAVSRPDHIVIDDEEYRRLNSGLKAEVPENDQGKADKSSG
jgi:hypothetical protein